MTDGTSPDGVSRFGIQGKGYALRGGQPDSGLGRLAEWGPVPRSNVVPSAFSFAIVGGGWAEMLIQSNKTDAFCEALSGSKSGEIHNR